MKLMSYKTIHSAVVMAAGLVLLASSCSKVKDLYEPQQGDTTTLIPNASIPAGFNWSTSKTIDVRVAVNDQYDGKYFYKLELFDREPDAEGATLLAAGLAKKNQDWATKVTIPSALGYVYLKQTNPVGQVSYSMIEVTGSTALVAQLPTSTAVRAAINVQSFGLKAASIPTSSNPTFVRTASPAVPASALAIEGSKDIDYGTVVNNKVLIIKAGKTLTGNIALNNGIENVVVYVEGTWAPSNKKGVVIGTGNKVIVLPSGKITATELTQNNSGVFTNYGETVVEKLNMPNTSKYENYGKLTVSTNSVFNGTINNLGTLSFAGDFTAQGNTARIYNEGTFDVKGTLSIPSTSSVENFGTTTLKKIIANSESVVTNHAVMTIEEASFTNPIVNVNCFTTIIKMDVNGAKVNIASGARLDITNLNSGGGIYNLAAGSVLDVKNEAKFSTFKNFIIGMSTAQKAVAQMKTVTMGSGPSMEYQGNLEVAYGTHTVNPQYNPSYKAESNVTMGANYGKIVSVIPTTACNGGGLTTTPTTPPVDQTLNGIVLGTYSYAFEDKWPVIGDYDMNDLVMDVQITKFQNTDNKVTKVVLKNKVRAVGASKRLAAAIQLDNVLAAGVKSVKYSKTNLVGTVLPLSSNGVESGQNKAVVTVVDDAHKAFGLTNTDFINTLSNTLAPVETEITIEFATPLANFTFDDLNPFIVNFAQNQGGRNEVHLVGRAATDKINKSLVATEQGPKGSLSASDPFKSKDNYPFALAIPTSFTFPAEYKGITLVYPNFSSWVTSGGSANKNWYEKIGK